MLAALALAAVVVATPAGLVLIDGGLPQSVSLVLANLVEMGHDVRDVRWILMSHAHHDHVGGIAALARLSGARVAASPAAAAALRRGTVLADDPQASPKRERFPKVRSVTELPDGATVRLGGTTLTMHHTPGHTPGGTRWTWRSCEGDRCLAMAYADSLTSVSADGFRFSAQPARVAQFRRTIAAVRELPCDVLLTPHPGFSRLLQRQAARAQRAPGAPDPMIDPGACRAYADGAAEGLAQRLAEEAQK